MSPGRRRRPESLRFEIKSDDSWDFYVAGDNRSVGTNGRAPIRSSERKTRPNNPGGTATPASSSSPSPSASAIAPFIDELTKIVERLEAAVTKIESQANEIRVPRLPEIPRYNRP
ncbi:MAG: hypothetical protein WAM97_07745 [Acidimicrobiales bacterium]|jgi:hypothetical protein